MSGWRSAGKLRREGHGAKDKIRCPYCRRKDEHSHEVVRPVDAKTRGETDEEA